MSSVTTMTRDEQKDLIREVLREQPSAASRAASPRPPSVKKQRLDPFFDNPRIRALSDRYQWDMKIYGPCVHCNQPKIWNDNFAGCCGCPVCSCPKCRRINERAAHVLPHLLNNIHEEVERRRLWCAERWGCYGRERASANIFFAPRYFRYCVQRVRSARRGGAAPRARGALLLPRAAAAAPIVRLVHLLSCCRTYCLLLRRGPLF